MSFYSFWIRHESLTSFFLSESNFLGIHRFSILWRKQWRMWQGVCRYKGRAEMSVSVRVPPPPGRANLSRYFEIILKFLKLNILYMYCMYYIWKLSNFEVFITCLYTLVWWGNTLMKKYGTFPVQTDEDECAVSNGGCSHKCLNTEGSYECVCPKGFKVQYNQRVCVGEREF